MRLRLIDSFMAICALVFLTGVLARPAMAERSTAVSLASHTPVLRLSVTDGATHELSISALQALPMSQITTNTHWTAGKQQFTGVRLWDLLDHFEVEAGTLELTARNEYVVKIPVDDITPDYGLIAYHQNGELMPTRGKGPFWLVFDYDSDPAFRQEVVYSRSIWQLDRIAVVSETVSER